MPTPATLPGRLVVSTRDQVITNWLRDYKLRNPAADTRSGTQPFIDASAHADALMPLYLNATIIAANASRSSKTGQDLTNEARAEGTDRLPAACASGYVTISASVAGTTIFAGDEIKRNDGQRFQCLATSLYQDQAQVPIGQFTATGADPGPGSNTAAATTLTWTSPRPGCSPTAVVVTQQNGTGLAGGADAESDVLLQSRLASLAANPPASGNDAQYQAIVLKTPGLSIGNAFTYPSILGPGTIGIVFLMLAPTPGSNRIPSAAQIARVLAWLTGQMPADDVILVGTVVAQSLDVAFRITWAQGGTPGWTDLVPWPTYVSPKVACKINKATTPTVFTLDNVNGIPAPQVGNTIAFYDAPNQVFRRKKVLTATFAGGNTYDIVCDTTNNSSDTSYAPISTVSYGQPCCPWSDSLNALVPPTVAYFDGLGPGEQKSAFFDPGLRERRSPRSPQFSSSEVSNRMLAPLFALTQVQNVSLSEPTVPFATTVGTPGVSSNLIVLRAVVAYPT